MVVWVVAEGMVCRCLQGERLVETISREVPLIRGSEVKPVWGHSLLWCQVPPAVGSGAGGRVFVLLAHAHGVPAVEAALRKRAHVLFREVTLGVAAPWQQLLALYGGGGEALRVRRSIKPGHEVRRKRAEKSV